MKWKWTHLKWMKDRNFDERNRNYNWKSQMEILEMKNTMCETNKRILSLDGLNSRTEMMEKGVSEFGDWAI